jgi:choline-glycine betaine transporter
MTTFSTGLGGLHSPFEGLFLVRISKGRTIRELLLGCVIAPALFYFLWMTILGATSINLKLKGDTNVALVGASNTVKLLVTLGK